MIYRLGKMERKRQQQLTFFERNRMNFDIFGALFSVFSHALGLYLVFRWGRTIQNANEDTRRQLLGDFFADNFQSAEYIAVVIASYLGYKLLLFLIRAADWQRYLETQQLRKYKHIDN